MGFEKKKYMYNISHTQLFDMWTVPKYCSLMSTQAAIYKAPHSTVWAHMPVDSLAGQQSSRIN